MTKKEKQVAYMTLNVLYDKLLDDYNITGKQATSMTPVQLATRDGVYRAMDMLLRLQNDIMLDKVEVMV